MSDHAERGEEARQRRSFTREFKAEIVELGQRGDRSVGQVARDFDLTETAMREWVSRRPKIGRMTDMMNATVGSEDMLQWSRPRAQSGVGHGCRLPREKGAVSLTAPYRAHGEQALRTRPLERR